jgi:hypothetical protein
VGFKARARMLESNPATLLEPFGKITVLKGWKGEKGEEGEEIKRRRYAAGCCQSAVSDLDSSAWR